MRPLEIFLQFLTVFLGAFLAFLLENCRERRQLGGWANQLLIQVRNQMITQSSAPCSTIADPNELLSFYNKLFDKGVDQNEWSRLFHMQYGETDDYSFLLKSEAVKALPLDVIQKLVELERSLRGQKLIAFVQHALSKLSLSAERCSSQCIASLFYSLKGRSVSSTGRNKSG